MNFMNTKNIIRISIFALAFTTIITACKKNYDGPPSSTNPQLIVTTTIAQLKAMHTVAGNYDLINTDVIISGVVIANDRSGNLYKELYIQDATGGLSLQLASNGLYTNYPVGKRLFVKCRGLYLSDYNNMIQLGVRAIINGSPSLEAIPTPLIPNYVIGGTLNNPVVPKIVQQSDLNNPTGVQTMHHPLVGDLIQLNDYEFLLGDTRKTYGDTSNYKKAGERYIKNCSGGTSIMVRTSGYADFASQNPAMGNGSIAAILTVFSNTRQLILRDLSDVKFTGGRCNLFEEDFQASPTTGSSCLNLTDWKNIKETGDVCFRMAAFGSSIFPSVSAFSSTTLATTNITSWLISPAINLPAGLSPKYTFTCSRRYVAGTFTAYVSTNYNGGAIPSTATWTLLTTVPPGTAAAFTPFDLFGPFDLTAYAGQNVYLAFKYEALAGTTPSLVGTYRPDDLKITKN